MEIIGSNGIFISDSAREQLNISLSEEEFQALKEHMNKTEDPNSIKKCFITNTMCKTSDGLMISRDWMADSIQKTIDTQDKIHKEYLLEDLVRCSKCGFKETKTGKEHSCSKCSNKINLKKYEKSVKLPFAKRMAFQLYIKFLRK